MIEKEATTFTFIFKTEELSYNFNIPAPTREEALKVLRAGLASVIADINEELHENK